MAKPSAEAEHTLKMVELSDLQDRWREAFGESLGIGFDVTTDDISRIRRCLAAGSPAELHDRIKRDVDAGLVF
jgi:hypothetical protein